MELLYRLESLRTPVLDAIFGTLTELGGEVTFLVAALILYWCVDKRQGIYLMAVGFLGTLTNQFLKLTCRIPRPWVLDPEFTIVESARAGASGYSFPSGHSTSSVGTFASLAVLAQKRPVKWLCIAICVLVPFTRMYLGVHTPADVLVGAGLALVCVFGLRPVVFSPKKRNLTILLDVLLVLGAGFLLYTLTFPFPADIDRENLNTAIQNGYTLLGSLLGMMVAYYYDERRLHFPTAAPWYGQVLKILGGLVLVLAVKSGLKAPLETLLAGHPLSRLIRYFLVVIAAGVVWPMTFPWFARMGGKEHTQ